MFSYYAYLSKNIYVYMCVCTCVYKTIEYQMGKIILFI